MTDARGLMPGIQVIVCSAGGPSNNIYLLETDDGLMMVDAGWLSDVPTIADGIGALGWRPEDVKIILLTHAHPDHYGGAAGLKQLTGAAVMAHEADAPAIAGERRVRMPPRPIMNLVIQRLEESQGVSYPRDTAFWFPPPVAVDRRLRNGDRIGGWQVIHAPGHTPGNISLYHPARKILCAGNWIAMSARASRSRGVLQGGFGARLIQGLLAPLINHFMDREVALASARRLAALDFETLLLSHGALAGFPAIAGRLRAEFGAQK